MACQQICTTRDGRAERTGRFVTGLDGLGMWMETITTTDIPITEPSWTWAWAPVGRYSLRITRTSDLIRTVCMTGTRLLISRTTATSRASTERIASRIRNTSRDMGQMRGD